MTGGAAAGAELDVLVRPEAVAVRSDVDGGARVVAATFLGAMTRLTVRLTDGAEINADLSTPDAAALGAGASVSVALPDRPVLVDSRRASHSLTLRHF